LYNNNKQKYQKTKKMRTRKKREIKRGIKKSLLYSLSTTRSNRWWLLVQGPLKFSCYFLCLSGGARGGLGRAQPTRKEVESTLKIF
jgi:hypothetical protein